jgi:oligogalacturonide lyase
MKMPRYSLLAFILFIVSLDACRKAPPPVLETGGTLPMPEEWIDEDTGHRILRLTGPEGDSRSFYFHNNPFIPGSHRKAHRMVYYGNIPENTNDRDFTPRGNRQLFIMNLETLENKQITNHSGFISGEIVGKKTDRVFYQSRDSVFSTHIETGETELVYVFPDSVRGQISTLNADETLLGGVAWSREKYEILRQYPMKGDFFRRIFEARIPHSLITIDVETGVLREIFSDTAWLNHVQFSPTDPYLLMFCHEGPWHLLDRIWTIDIRSPEARLMHKRTVYREIAGHEFFSPDGKTIWFDLQIPRGETFFLAGLDLASGQEKRYALERDEWSVHFNISPDQQLFAGDGGDPGQVARAKDGQWIYLFRPAGDSLDSEKLVNMKNHDYRLEPNVHFSPDGKWIIFRANFEGSSQIYAVEVAGS